MKKCTSCNIDKLESQFGKHKNGRNGLNSYCRRCRNLKSKCWASKNPINRRVIVNRHRAKYPDRELSRRLRKYNLTVEQYRDLLKNQNNLCKICGVSDIQSKLHVDHDHVTNVVRGLLCTICNKALGGFKDSVALLHSAILYLKATPNGIENDE